MNIGCCGRRPTSLAGLLVEADNYPASHPRGAYARRKIAYTVAAAKAKQAGNRGAYNRAMAGLNSLGDAASDAAATSQQIQQLMTSTTGGSARVTAVTSQIRTWVNLVTGLASIGTTIGTAAGGDANAIRVANMVIGWIRAIGNGTLPPIPTLSPNDIAGFVNYCANIRPLIETGLLTGFSVASTAISATNNFHGDANATNALNTLQTWLIGGPSGGGGLLNGVCTIPQIAAAIQAAATPPASAPPPVPTMPTSQTGRCWDGTPYTQSWDPTTQRWSAGVPACTPPPPALGLEAGAGGCAAGSFNTIAPGGIQTTDGRAVPGTAGAKNCARCSSPSIYVPGVTNPATGLWTTPPACVAPNGRVIGGPASGPCPAGTSRGSDGICAGSSTGGGGSSSGGSSVATVALPAAALLWYFLR